MKVITVATYLITSMVCLYWSTLTFFAGIYGIGISWGALFVFMGALCLMMGAILTLVSAQQWSHYISALGSTILVIYFVPAFFVSLSEYMQEQVSHDAESVIILLTPLLVVISFCLSVFRAFHLKNDKTGGLSSR